MKSIPKRPPIAYDDIRRPYNMVRGLGAVAFIVGVIIWSSQSDTAHGAFLAAPALLIVIDAIYRGRSTAPALPGLIIDSTVIGVAMMLRGTSTGVHAVAVLVIVVAASLMLAYPSAIAIVSYMIAWSLTSNILDRTTDLPFIGVVEGDNTDLLDLITVTVLISIATFILALSVRVILAAQDRQAEALAQERRALELKNEFVSMVSHELRTPLTGIAGFTDTLSETWTTLPTNEIDEFLAIMSQEAEHLSNLVEDILVIPRLEAGQLRLDPVDLDLAVEVHTVAEVVFPDTDYSVAIPAGVTVNADRTRLRQIMRNLLENAKKYGGDQLLIEGELSAPGFYTVFVSDNGSGVEPEDRERIFQHFEQLSSGDARLQQGVGLGLPIARKLARAMGGDLWYQDRFPVGAMFCFTVKVAATHRESDADVVPHAHA